MSDNVIKDLAAAYTEAFAEITNAVKNTKNPHLGNTYADLGAVLATVRPVLARHGLAVLQIPGKVSFVDGVHVVSMLSMLLHSSGQSISSETQVPIAPQVDKKTGAVRPIDAQRAGSAMTYARRYALAALCGITQQDDDGEAASATEEPEGPNLAELSGRIAAASDVPALEQLRPQVKAAGDRDVADEFLAKLRGFTGKGKK
jgi:hypothetical protein